MNQNTEYFIAICGLVLTAASVVASYMQYRAADLQAKAAIVQLKPQIQIRSFIEKVDSDKFTDRRLEVSNEGGPAYNFYSERLTWIALTPVDSAQNYSPIIEQIMYGYFSFVSSTGNIRGQMEAIAGHKNNEKFFQVYERLRHSTTKKWDITYPKTLLHFRYDDSLKEQNEEYFLVDSVSVRRLAAEDGQIQWKRLKEIENNRQLVDLDGIQDPQQLNNWLSEATKGEAKGR